MRGFPAERRYLRGPGLGLEPGLRSMEPWPQTIGEFSGVSWRFPRKLARSTDGTALELMVRGKALPAVVAPTPFIPHRYAR